MGDRYCAKCGEPWDASGVRDALRYDRGDMTKHEAEMFMAGKGCPSCHFGTKSHYRLDLDNPLDSVDNLNKGLP